MKPPQECRGATNQKPLTIKPYPMKIHNEYKSSLRFKEIVANFFMPGNRVSTILLSTLLNFQPV